jgi:hypothetical protein
VPKLDKARWDLVHGDDHLWRLAPLPARVGPGIEDRRRTDDTDAELGEEPRCFGCDEDLERRLEIRRLRLQARARRAVERRAVTNARCSAD